jgi:hypothetical protein
MMAKPRAAASSHKTATGWRPSSPYRLVAVEWEDSQRPLAPWQWVDEYALPDAVCCISVGFLISQTDAALALAPNLGDVECDRAQACGIIRIPVSAVRRMADL